MSSFESGFITRREYDVMSELRLDVEDLDIGGVYLGIFALKLCTANIAAFKIPIRVNSKVDDDTRAKVSSITYDVSEENYRFRETVSTADGFWEKVPVDLLPLFQVKEAYIRDDQEHLDRDINSSTDQIMTHA
jgi:hypothetical protein